MNAVRRFSAILLLTALLAGCAHGSSPANPGTPVVGATQAASPGGGTAKPASPTASVVPAPSVEDARTLALRWVASTGDLLKMGPIGRSELLRQRVASVSAETMTENLNSDLAKLADGLPNSELWMMSGIGHSPLLEAPEIVNPRILEFFRTH